MEQREGNMASMRDLIAEKTIELDTLDPIARFGFTQVPNFILTNSTIGVGAKLTYAMFLHYAWNNNSCFPGQDRLAEEIGMSRPRVNEFIKELERAGFITITRRGQGKTNLYRLKFAVHPKEQSKARARKS